jgi:single-stranded DNA-binding protein
MRDTNSFVLEGNILGNPEPFTTQDNKLVLNIIIANKQKDRTHTYNAVLWHDAATLYKDKLKDGVHVIARGYLHRAEIISAEGGVFYYSKPSVVSMEFPFEEMQAAYVGKV